MSIINLNHMIQIISIQKICPIHTEQTVQTDFLYFYRLYTQEYYTFTVTPITVLCICIFLSQDQYKKFSYKYYTEKPVHQFIHTEYIKIIWPSKALSRIAIDLYKGSKLEWISETFTWISWKNTFEIIPYRNLKSVWYAENFGMARENSIWPILGWGSI